MLQVHSFNSLLRNHELSNQMFQDRGQQFVDRLRWDIPKDQSGREQDQYDNESAYYVIWVGRDGQHRGSVRLASTINSYMVEDHFQGHFPNIPKRKTTTWELTRFCISPSVPSDDAQRVTSNLAEGTIAFGLESGVREFIGICYPNMLRVYRRKGWYPQKIQRSSVDRRTTLARWDIKLQSYLELLTKSNERAKKRHKDVGLCAA